MNCSERSDRIVTNGTSIHLDIYESDRSLPAVVFIPGMGCYAGIYGEFLRSLASRGFNVVGVDLPGHGRSGGGRGVFTFAEIMTCISDVVTYAAKSFKGSTGLMGSSLGGTYALYAAMQDARLKAVLCHNAMDIARDLHVPTRFKRIVGFSARRLRSVARMASRLPVPLRAIVDWKDVVESRDLMDSLKSDGRMVWRYSLGSWMSFLDYRPQAGFRDIRAPVKIIVGEGDRLFPPDYCKALAERIGERGASFQILQGRHALPMEHVPDTVAVARAWFHEKLNDGGAS
jgi:pimeloyl-ACP methyl ester carboxylesterase